MKILSILFFLAGTAVARAQTTYTVSPLYSFPAPNTGPSGITVDSHGNIYAAGNFAAFPNAPSIAQIFAPSSNGGNGSAVVIAGGTLNGFADGTGSSAQFSVLAGMAADTLGNVYISDALKNNSFTVRQIAPSTRIVSTLSGLNGNAQIFGNANGVAVSASGNVYVSNAGGASSRLLQYVPGGTPIAIDTGSITDLQDGGRLVSVYEFYGVTVDSSSALYATAVAIGAVDVPKLYVLKISGTAVSQLFALPLGANPQTEESLSSSGGTVPITVDSAGNVYVGWYGNLYLYNGQATPTLIAAFGGPIVGLTTDSSGRIYIAYGPPGFPGQGMGPGKISVVAPATVTPLPTTLTTVPTTGTSTTPAARFVNISTRAFVGTGSNVAVAGFVISGSATEQVLIRGVGPSLTQFSVSGVLAQPVLTLFNSAGTQLATNTGWSTNLNAPQISAAFSTTGAFALPSGSTDSALLLSLAPGAYTAQVSGLNNTSGTALIEVYEVP